MIEKQELKKVLAALFQANRDVAESHAMMGALTGNELETRTAIQIHGAAKGVTMVADYFGIKKEELEVEIPKEAIEEILKVVSERLQKENEKMAKEMVGMILGKGPLGTMGS